MERLDLTGVQAQSILDMPLRRLVSLERKKMEDERKELLARIKLLKEILGSQEKRLQLVMEETEEIKDKYAEPRRTVIVESEEGHKAAMTVSDLVIPTEAQLVMVGRGPCSAWTRKGTANRSPKINPAAARSIFRCCARRWPRAGSCCW